jgi:gliding motility-associated-like protein
VYDETGIEINLTGNDFDIENEGLKIDTSFIIIPNYGYIESMNDSSITYIPYFEYNELTDEFAYQVCDFGIPQECKEGLIRIKISLPPGLIVYDAFSPNGDNINDLWIIDGILEYPGNTVKIYNQWNNEVYSVSDYDNSETVWTGQSNMGSTNEAVDGTYYYVINLGDGSEALSGFVVLKR